MKNALSLLHRTFPGLSDEQIEELLSHAREASYPPGTVLCREGNYETIFYIIVEGQVEINKWLEFKKEERLLRYSDVGDFFGEMGILHDAPRGATVRTTRPTTVLEIHRDDFLQLLSRNPRMALTLVRITMDRLRSNDQMQLQELQRTYDDLQKLDQAKLDFIEVAAHELRTPLTVIQGYSKVLEFSPLAQDESTYEVVAGLLEGVNRMLQVVNAMLDVSRIDGKMLKVSSVPVLPKMLATEALNAFDDVLEKRRIQIKERHEPISFAYLQADPALMNKLFYQLISNAIKYTPDGGTISVHSREVNDSRIGQGIEIVIHDNGVGISSEHMQYIFEKFYQGGDVSLHSSSKSAFMGGGPGLGLAIARGIVEAHQGLIWAESAGYDPKNMPGTAFHVLLPAQQPSR